MSNNYGCSYKFIDVNHILIIAAHLDDFELGMGGTAAKLSEHNVINLLVLCKGDKPGNELVAVQRKKTCEENCKELNITPHYMDFSDTKLDTVPQTELCNIIYNTIDALKCDTIYTHNINDIHRDHQIVSNTTRVACRMRETSTVNELYEYSVPGSTEWSFNPVVFNTFHDITNYVNQKNKMIYRYTTELKKFPDPMSAQSITNRDSYHGSLCGVPYAEAFNQIFKRC